MSELMSPPHAIAFLGHPNIPDALEVAGTMAEIWRAMGGRVQVGSLYDEELRQRVKAGEFDLVIALGGDGTMLRTGHLCAPADIPLLGVNIGHFGFLVEVKRDNWREALTQLAAGKFRFEDRMMIAGPLFTCGRIRYGL